MGDLNRGGRRLWLLQEPGGIQKHIPVATKRSDLLQCRCLPILNPLRCFFLPLYPIEFIDNIAVPSMGDHPKNIFFLTADAYGVLPPISKLTSASP